VTLYESPQAYAETPR